MRNYGWSISEGSHIFHAKRQAGPDPISPPTAEHPHSEARSLTGGRVYRGTRLPELVGAYVYGDWSTGRVWGIKHDGTKAIWHRELVDTPFNITGFGTDHAGELYVIDHGSGFYRLEPTTEADRPSQPFPTRLSQTGLFASVADHKPHPAALVVSRSMHRSGPTGRRSSGSPPCRAWSGSSKSPSSTRAARGRCPTARSWFRRSASTGLTTPASRPASESRRACWFGSRGNGPVTPTAGTPSRPTPSWSAPAASARRSRCPTRPQPGGRREQDWRFPARTECLVCHSRAAGFVAGFTPLQLDRDRDYGGTIDNQLRTLEHIGVFQGTLPRRRDDQPRLVNPYETQGSAGGPGQIVPARQLLDLPRQ